MSEKLFDILNQLADLRQALQILRERGIEIETVPYDEETIGKLPIISKIYYVLDGSSIKKVDVGNEEEVKNFTKQVVENRVSGNIIIEFRWV